MIHELERGRVRERLENALLKADHLDLDGVDSAGVEALRALADKIDQWDVIVRWAVEDAAATKAARPAVPQNDNVTLSAYLKGLHQFGLTPESRGSLGKGVVSGGTVIQLPPDAPFNPDTA